MLALNAELVYLILQFCREEELTETLHVLERETSIFFDLNYFETLVLSGRWEELERYLSGYGSLEDNKFFFEVFFEVRKHKLFEALAVGNQAKALEVFKNELEVFASHDEEFFKEVTPLLTSENFRTHKLLRNYGDIHSARSSLSKKLSKIIEVDPSFHGKLEFPTIEMARLRCLINQSLNWQHLRCENPKQIPDVETLFEDHICQPTVQLIQRNLKPAYPVYSEASVVTSTTINDACKTELSTGSQEEVRSCTRDSPESKLLDLPVTVGCCLNEESSPTTMDFHPYDDSILLVGTDCGDVSIWDIVSRRKLLFRSFEIWCIEECTTKFKETFMDSLRVLAKCAKWSSGGDLIGVAFSQHIVQIYTYEAGIGIFQSLEVDAHDGSVNDISFSERDEETFAITCGDDKMVKVWDASTGAIRYVFDGHKAAVTCACPAEIEGVNLIVSTSVNGEMRGWMYDNLKHRIAVDDHCYRRMVCSKDGKRIFSCGINEEAKSCILEWDYESNSIQNTYEGLQKPCPGVVKFDTAKNQILAAGDNHQIKFWDMRNRELVSSTDTSESFPVYPYIRFNKDGALLAVSSIENRIVILATAYGLELLTPTQEHHCVVCARDFASPVEVSSISNGEDNHHGALLLEKHPGFHFRKLPIDVKGGKICRMVYTNAGESILALTSSGTHLVWRWLRSETSSIDNDRALPHIWKPENGSSVMLNILGPFPDTIVSCFALTANDSYLISGSGGELSLFNIFTFKRLSTFLPPLPQTTAVAVYPKDNNIIAIGRSDSTILVYNIPLGKIECKLEGHCGQITDLAFSNALDTLISMGADSKICAWDTEKWVMKANTSWARFTRARIQFHQDQVHFLVIHDSVLAIYDARILQRINQWFVKGSSSRISCASFSCDGKMLYVCFRDATISIFYTSSLQLSSRISVRLQVPINIYPTAIAVHPKKEYQLALGLSDGTAAIIEYSEPICRTTMLPKESQFYNA